jgi:hypothetical protein
METKLQLPFRQSWKKKFMYKYMTKIIEYDVYLGVVTAGVAQKEV